MDGPGRAHKAKNKTMLVHLKHQLLRHMSEKRRSAEGLETFGANELLKKANAISLGRVTVVAMGDPPEAYSLSEILLVISLNCHN